MVAPGNGHGNSRPVISRLSLGDDQRTAGCQSGPGTRTANETSIVCPADLVPAGVRCESGWRCLRVAGTLDFGMVGVLAGPVGPLAAAGVSVFVMSTFDTDYVLIKGEHLDRALRVLEDSGATCESLI